MEDHLLIRELVKKIIANPSAYEWTIQGFGMLRTYMENGLRMTIWHEKFRVPQVSMIHSHPWDFQSYVVCGRIINRRLVCVSDASGMPYMRQKIKAGEGGGLEGEPEMVHLGVARVDVIDWGERYSQMYHELHESNPLDGTITLCHRQVPEGNSPDHAFVCWPKGYDWVSAEPKPASLDIVEECIKAAQLRIHDIEGTP